MNEYTVFRCDLCGQERDKDEYGEPDTLFRDGKELSVCCVCYDAEPGDSSHPTPGLWTVDECPDANGFCTVRVEDGTPNGDTDREPIATVYADPDARLIACAPELLSALVEAERVLDGPVCDSMTGDECAESGVYDALSVVREAIRKATGK